VSPGTPQHCVLSLAPSSNAAGPSVENPSLVRASAGQPSQCESIRFPQIGQVFHTHLAVRKNRSQQVARC